MNAVAGVAGANAALASGTALPVAGNLAVPGAVQMSMQFDAPLLYPLQHLLQTQPVTAGQSMQALLAQLEKVTGTTVEQDFVSPENLQKDPEALSIEPTVVEALQQLPAMQSVWNWPQAFVPRNMPMAQWLKDVPQVAVSAMADTASCFALEQPLVPVVKNASDAASPLVAIVQKQPGEMVGMHLDQSMPVLNLSARGVEADTLRPVLSNSAMPPPSDTLPVYKGSQTLMQALADRIQVQQAQGTQIATVRLDPPQMGSLEIRIRQDATGVHVQMHASHAEVGRQLVSLVESLRQELLVRSHDAHVTVSHSRSATSGGQSDARHQEQASNDEPEIGQALQSIEYGVLT